MGRSTITPGRQKDLMRPLKVEPVAAPVPSRGVGSTSASRAARVAASASGEIRIIGGQWRRTKLTVLARTDLRPTPDRVRETLFNWLGQDMGGWRCLDAFAGTGALGLEAASRNAAQVRMVESDSGLAAQLHQQVEKLGATTVDVVRGDALAALQSAGAGRWDVIFLDPPFTSTLFVPALKASHAALADDGYVYLEAPTLWTEEELAPLGFVLHKQLKAGAVFSHLLRKRVEA